MFDVFFTCQRYCSCINEQCHNPTSIRLFKFLIKSTETFSDRKELRNDYSNLKYFKSTVHNTIAYVIYTNVWFSTTPRLSCWLLFALYLLYNKDNPTCKGISQIVPGARTASKIYYSSHMILLTVRAPELICESPFSGCFLHLQSESSFAGRFSVFIMIVIEIIVRGRLCYKGR